jgi:putative addiction module killer protein
VPGFNIINEYITADDHPPYSEWLEGLRDPRAKAKIIMQVDRMELGLFGDSEPVGEGVSELRIHYGPGYRVYYAKDGKNVYLILCGGDKSTQKKDIKLAKHYWSEHKHNR